jgi:hypothetical protein
MGEDGLGALPQTPFRELFEKSFPENLQKLWMGGIAVTIVFFHGLLSEKWEARPHCVTGLSIFRKESSHICP